MRWIITYRYATHDPYYHGEKTTTVEAPTDHEAREIVKRENLATITFVRVREARGETR